MGTFSFLIRVSVKNSKRLIWFNSVKPVVVLFISAFLLSSISKAQELLSTTCNIYMNSSPLTRTTGFGEENIINGNYQAVAQQYNSISGALKAVTFWARVNPASGAATNLVKVFIYQANQGLPGVVLGQTTILVDSSSTMKQYTATFTSAINVSGSIIISIEPFAPTTDNFFVRRNVPVDGQFLNLIKIKQNNQWFKNLAAGDTAFDYDFLIIPLKAVTVTSNYTYSVNANEVTFTNTSVNASSYYWDFGDGDTSTAVSPVHTFSTTGNYNVSLVAYANPNTCQDSIAKTIVLTSAPGLKKSKGLIINQNNDLLIIESPESTEVSIYDVFGNCVRRMKVTADQRQEVFISDLSSGLYLISSDGNSTYRIIKN